MMEQQRIHPSPSTSTSRKGWISILLLMQLYQLETTLSFSPLLSTPLRKSTVTTARASNNIALKVSVAPQDKASPAADDEEEQQQKQEPQSLFEIVTEGDNDDDNGAFQVKDMSSFQENSDEELDIDMLDMDAVDVDYELEYDNEYEDEEDLYNTNIDDMDTSIYSKNMISGMDGDHEETEFDAYSRDQDDILEEREDRLYVDNQGLTQVREKCILVGVENLSAKRRETVSKRSANPEEWEVYFDLDQSMDEMKELISTGGMELAGVMTQRLNEVNPRMYIGTGKVLEVQQLLEEVDCCTVVFDAELSPGQQKTLENAFNKEIIQNDFLGSEQATIKVVDRTALILDIFAQHAKTREGKLQVDLALHEYRKPRLTRMWTHLERQSGAGGVGLRGPGESQLEIDKRLIKDRIIVLKRKIDSVQKQRDIHRKGRSNLGLPVLALVGYTNAGKSTLLNYLTKAGVLAESMLFATLDPTTRKVKLPGLQTHPEVLLTDTVGFIQKLPTQLVAAFRATLEEVKEADVLVHVVDSSNPVWQKQELAVKKVLEEIGAGDKPIVRVLNKIDKLDPDIAEDLQYEAAMMDDFSVAISSISGEGMTDLVSTIEDAMMGLLVPIEVMLPYTQGNLVNMVQEVGHVEEMEYRDEGTYLLARVPEAVANRLKTFSVNGEGVEKEESSDDEDEIDWVAIGRGRHPKKKEL